MMFLLLWVYTCLSVVLVNNSVVVGQQITELRAVLNQTEFIYVKNQNQFNFFEAREDCLARGGDLASIKNEAEKALAESIDIALDGALGGNQYFIGKWRSFFVIESTFV